LPIHVREVVGGRALRESMGILLKGNFAAASLSGSSSGGESGRRVLPVQLLGNHEPFTLKVYNGDGESGHRSMLDARLFEGEIEEAY
jgi:hypothetical protein